MESSESEEQEISGEAVEGKAEKGESEVGVDRVETGQVMIEIFSDPDSRHQRASLSDSESAQPGGRGEW